MEKVAGQNLSMFWAKVDRTVLGQVNNLRIGNKTVDNA